MDIRLDLRDVKIDRDKLASEVTPKLVRVHSGITRRVKERAIVNAPNDTGALDRSIREDAQVVTPLRVSGGVTAHARHAIFVHEGTRPHVIRTDPENPMVFRIGGMKVFTEVVHSPGQRPNPFLRRALNEVAATIGVGR